jgi:hypothetical protein
MQLISEGPHKSTQERTVVLSSSWCICSGSSSRDEDEKRASSHNGSDDLDKCCVTQEQAIDSHPNNDRKNRPKRPYRLQTTLDTSINTQPGPRRDSKTLDCAQSELTAARRSGKSRAIGPTAIIDLRTRSIVRAQKKGLFQQTKMADRYDDRQADGSDKATGTVSGASGLS